MADGFSYEAAFDSVYNGQAVTNVFKASQVGSNGTGDARNALANAINTTIWPAMKTLLVQGFEQRQYRVRGIYANETQTVIVPASDTGDVNDVGYPPNLVLVMRCYSQQIGRKGTGGYRFSGIPQNNCRNGNFDGLYLGGWENVAEVIQKDIEDITSGYVFRLGVSNDDLEAVINWQRAEPQYRGKTLSSRTIGAFAQ